MYVCTFTIPYISYGIMNAQDSHIAIGLDTCMYVRMCYPLHFHMVHIPMQVKHKTPTLPLDWMGVRSYICTRAIPYFHMVYIYIPDYECKLSTRHPHCHWIGWVYVLFPT